MEENIFGYSVDGNLISVRGAVDGKAAAAITILFNPGTIYVLDFEDVCSVNFAALREFLRTRKSGKRFCVINASNEVCEKFEDTGVAYIVNISRKPKALDISKYTEFGASFLSKAFNSGDGDSMIKLYGPRVPKQMVAQEKAVAKAVMLFGLNTPLVGSLYTDGTNMALDFERIEGKRSFSRIISEEPERLEEISAKFAKMCKELHVTPCDTNIFPDRSILYRQAVTNCHELSENVIQNALKFLDSVPAETTCLHGDMQLSNVITTGKEDMWIDLSDFSYGNHMFDLGMLYFLSRLNPERRMQDLFHFGHETMEKVWPVFMRGYFNVQTDEEIEEANRSIEPFAALHMIYLGSTYGFEPELFGFINKYFG